MPPSPRGRLAEVAVGALPLLRLMMPSVERKRYLFEALCGEGIVVVDNDSLCTADEGYAVVSTYPDVAVWVGIDIGHAVRR